MKDCPNDLDLEAWVDGEHSLLSPTFEQHIAGCKKCAERIKELQELDLMIISAMDRSIDPKIDFQKLQEHASVPANTDKAETNFLNRRNFGIGLGLAASFLGAAFILDSRQSDNTVQIYPAIIGDYLTNRVANKPLDQIANSFEDLNLWFSSKLPFNLPNFVPSEGIQLLGGRLCWLLHRRIAALHFQAGDKNICMYVMEKSGLMLPENIKLPQVPSEPYISTTDGISSAFWKNGSLAFGCVGETNIEVLKSLVRQFYNIAYLHPDIQVSSRTS